MTASGLVTKGLDRDWRLRLAAFARLSELRRANNGSDVVSSAELAAGFEFEGERIRLPPPREGIWKPRQTDTALTVVTAPPRPGRPAPYDDDLDESSGAFSYRYEGSDPNLHRNRAVRRALELGRPLIYLIGLEKGLYQALFPAYVTADSPSELTFRLELDVDVAVLDPTRADVFGRAPAREYATRAVKVRLHQRRFRQLVVRAYQSQCAICRLRKEPLLDAAHILEDRHERGLPEIPNGLSLCKIHHAAYDVNILGVDPDSLVHVNADVLQEKDGPMLTWGLQKMDKVELWVPRSEAHKPNREFLAARYERFKAA
jgi:putative restriction endonuclease